MPEKLEPSDYSAFLAARRPYDNRSAWFTYGVTGAFLLSNLKHSMRLRMVSLALSPLVFYMGKGVIST